MRKQLLISLLILPACIWAGVHISISGGIDNAAIKSKMEYSMSALLTEVNAAQAGKQPRLEILCIKSVAFRTNIYVHAVGELAFYVYRR